MTMTPVQEQPVPPAPPGIFARHWPPPATVPSPAVLAGAAAAAVVAALVLVVTRSGIGWLVTGLVVAGTVPLAARRRPGPAELGWGLAALALLATGALRAGWLFAFCVVGALLAGSLALAGGRGARGLALGMSAGLLAAFRALPWASAGIRYARERRQPGGGPRIVGSVLVAVVLVVVFGALFVSADEVFARLVAGWVPPLSDLDLVSAALRGVTVLGIALGSAFLAARRPSFDEVPAAAPRTVRRIEWVLPLAALDVLFLAFVAVQFTVLFGGRSDYARDARSGFFQLVVITVLTLAVLGVAARWAPREERADRILLRVLPGTLAVLTLVIVASALIRMARYEQEYGWTRLRVLVGAVELWLGLLFVLVLVAGVRLRAGWLPRAVTGTAVAGLLAVALLNPDRFIADRNVDRYQRTGGIDVWYLSTLSADAAPALDRLPGRLRSCALAGIAADLDAHPDDWRTWNLDRAAARTVIARGPRPDDRDC
jgi:uncharacterized protein DUF4153